MGTRYGVGIDVGATYLRLAEVKKNGEGYQLTNAFSLKIGSPEVDGREAITEPQLQEIVRGRLQNTPFRKGVLGLSGKDLLYRYIHFPPLPAWKLNMMVEFQVKQGDAESEEISYDFRLLNLPKGLSNEYTVLASLAKTEQLTEVLESLKRAGIKPETVEPNPLALFNTFMTDNQRITEKKVLFIDVGALKTEIAIFSERNLYFIRTLPVGGQAFTEAIKDEFDISMDQAEELKLTKGQILADDNSTDDEELQRLSRTLRRTSLQLSSQIQATIRFAAGNIHLQDLAVDKYYISGGGARLKGLPRYWQSVFNLPVSVLNPFKGIDLSGFPRKRVEEVIEAPSVYTTAVGLALSAFGGEMVAMNILPEKEKKRNEFYGQKLPVYLALIIFFLATVVFSVFEGQVTAEVDSAREVIGNVNADLDGELQALDKHLEIADSIIHQYEFMTDRTDELRFSLTVLDLFNKARPSEIRMQSFRSYGHAESGKPRVTLAVLVSESATQSSQGVFTDFENGFRDRPEIGSVTVDNIEDSEGESQRLKLITFTVIPPENKE